MGYLRALLIRYPILMAILFAIFSLLALNEGFNEMQSTGQLADQPEKLTMAQILQRMNQGASELNVQLVDGQIDCSTLSYLETRYALVVKEYTADVLMVSDDGSVALFSFYKGTPSCAEIGAKPVLGIITKLEEEGQRGMYKTNLMGIRRYPNATIFRFCGDCTKASKYRSSNLTFGGSAITFLGFLFSLYYQWRKWSDEGQRESTPRQIVA